MLDSDENNIVLYRYKEISMNNEEGITLIEIKSDMEFDNALAKFEEIIKMS
jgi:hypothetical protein